MTCDLLPLALPSLQPAAQKATTTQIVMLPCTSHPHTVDTTSHTRRGREGRGQHNKERSAACKATTPMVVHVRCQMLGGQCGRREEPGKSCVRKSRTRDPTRQSPSDMPPHVVRRHGQKLHQRSANSTRSRTQTGVGEQEHAGKFGGSFQPTNARLGGEQV